MKVQIKLQSTLSDKEALLVDGEFCLDESVFSLSWIQPPEDGETKASQYQLSYDQHAQQMQMNRLGDYRMELLFSVLSPTKGTITTPHGTMEMDIHTHKIVVPQGHNPLSDGEDQCIELEYDLHMTSQETMKNQLTLWLKLLQSE